MEKPGVIMYAQADHLNGELLGAALDMFYQSGASNVNILATVTKKNRPGYVLIIDCPPSRIDAIETIFTRELRISGWHQIDTTHRYRNGRVIEKAVSISIGDISIQTQISGKVLDDDLFNVRPEAECCLAVKQRLREIGVDLPYFELEKHLRQALICEQDPAIVLNVEKGES